MKLYTLAREQSVDSTLAAVFDFFSKPENLARITPPRMGFNILTPSPVKMRAGTVIDYTIRIFGFRIHWRTLISSFDPPHGFTDEQLKGPYSLWHHSHRFESTERGARIIDTVTYALPFGWLGRLAHAAFVRRQLQRIFDYRHSMIERIFNNNDEQ